jgi:hypothetical protein
VAVVAGKAIEMFEPAETVGGWFAAATSTVTFDVVTSCESLTAIWREYLPGLVNDAAVVV